MVYPLSKKNFIFTVSTMLLIAGMIHLLRLLLGFDILIGVFTYPKWLSVFEMIVAFFLSYVGLMFNNPEPK